MKQIVKKAPIILLVSFSLVGCVSRSKQELMRIEEKTELKYLTDGKILFYYDDIKGFDSSGPVYCVLDYSNSNKKEEFISQFYKVKTGENSLQNENSDKFETAVNNFLQQWMGNDYSSFDEQYKLDFTKSYSYYCPCLEPFEQALIYYAETSTAYLIYLEI